MSVTVPIRSLADYEIQAEIEGVIYTLHLRWNERASAWFLDVLDAEGENMLRAGIKLVTDFPLGYEKRDRSPPGAFVIIDTTGGYMEPTFESLGAGSLLVYLTAAEIAAETA